VRGQIYSSLSSHRTLTTEYDPNTEVISRTPLAKTAFVQERAASGCDHDTPPKLSFTGLAMKRLSKGSMCRLKEGGGCFRGNGAVCRQCSVGVVK